MFGDNTITKGITNFKHLIGISNDINNFIAVGGYTINNDNNNWL